MDIIIYHQFVRWDDHVPAKNVCCCATKKERLGAQ